MRMCIYIYSRIKLELRVNPKWLRQGKRCQAIQANLSNFRSLLRKPEEVPRGAARAVEIESYLVDFEPCRTSVRQNMPDETGLV